MQSIFTSYAADICRFCAMEESL